MTIGAAGRRALGVLTPLMVAAMAAAPPAQAEVKQYTFRYGPFDMGGYGVKLGGNDVPTPGVDGHLTKMASRVVDSAGRPIPVKRVMLHHVVFLNMGRFQGDRVDEVYCPGSGERFYGTGEEKQRLQLPAGYGYPLRAADRWRMGWMLMNHRKIPDSAYIEYTLTVDTSPGMTPVRPFWLSAVRCKSDPIFNVPGGWRPGKTYPKRRDWTIPFTGRLIAGGSHTHGGTKNITLSQPRCRNRTLFNSRPIYGRPGHPVYNVLPVLHEPGPVNMSWLQTHTGIPVRAGERLRVTSNYDAHWPHTRVMGIWHVYIAPDAGASTGCARLPRDIRSFRTRYRGRRRAPHVTVPIVGRGRDGTARPIDRPPGKTHRLNRGATINVKSFAYSMRNLSIPVGAALRWKYWDSTMHDLTLANGPRAIGSPPMVRGRSFRRRFTTPGMYRMFCTRHPLSMTTTVAVRAPKKRR